MYRELLRRTMLHDRERPAAERLPQPLLLLLGGCGEQRNTFRLLVPAEPFDQQIAAELIEAHQRAGVDFVAFQDELFLHSRRRVDTLLDLLEGAGVRLRWACFARADRLDVERETCNVKREPTADCGRTPSAPTCAVRGGWCSG